jgi:hypothetical protein
VKLGLLILVFAGTVQMMGCGAGYSAARQTSTGTSGGIGPTQPSSSQHRVDLFWAASISPNVSRIQHLPRGLHRLLWLIHKDQRGTRSDNVVHRFRGYRRRSLLLRSYCLKHE